MAETFVVIGGDAAGMSAASKAKRDDPDLEVIALERGDWVSYAACGLPYYVKGSVESLGDLVAMAAETFREERDIDLRTGHEAIGIDPDARTVAVEADGRTYEQGYDALLVGTGARAIEPPIAGMELDGVFTLRSMDEGEATDAYVRAHDPDRAVIVGGGYIGVEMAEALSAHQIAIEMVEMLPRILEPFGERTAEVVADHLREQGVELHLDTAVQGVQGETVVEAVESELGTAPADLVIVGVGVAPNVELADEAGIELGPTGAIATDEYGRTNVDGVYAAGDCAEVTNVVTREPDHVPLGLTANRAGRAIGATVAGTPTPTGGTAGTAILKAFELGAARTGVIDADRASDAGFEPVSVTIEAPTRPHYYPGGSELTVTLMADDSTGRLLGGSVAGAEGVKRIDTVATALHGESTVAELERLDLAYAPPYSPVWDPILTAGKVLGGKLEGAV